MLFFFFWSASSPPHALSLPHLVMKVKRKEYIWETFPRFQIYFFHNSLVYFAIQRNLSISLARACIMAWKILHCIAIIFLMCLFLSWPEFIHPLLRLLHSVLGTHLLVKSRWALSCWIKLSFCALSRNVLWVIRSRQFSGTSPLCHKLWVQQDRKV